MSDKTLRHEPVGDSAAIIGTVLHIESILGEMDSLQKARVTEILFAFAAALCELHHETGFVYTSDYAEKVWEGITQVLHDGGQKPKQSGRMR